MGGRRVSVQRARRRRASEAPSFPSPPLSHLNALPVADADQGRHEAARERDVVRDGGERGLVRGDCESVLARALEDGSCDGEDLPVGEGGGRPPSLGGAPECAAEGFARQGYRFVARAAMQVALGLERLQRRKWDAGSAAGT
jgi:hypothetical protein